MLNKKKLVGVASAASLLLFINFNGIVNADTTNANNVREESIDSSERGATMKDPSFDTKITVTKTPSANTSSLSDSESIDSSERGATMKDPTFDTKITVDKTPSQNSSNSSLKSSNNKNDTQTYSKSNNTKTVTNTNVTSATSTDNAGKTSNSSKYITSKSNVLPQTSEKNGSSISVIVGALLFCTVMFWIFDYKLVNKFKM